MKKNKPTVSVMLPSYKHHLWIGEAIESVLNQSFSDLELIIVDDGSDDDSMEIIKEYGQRDERIKYEIFNENRGAVLALKRCYDLCSADYIALISSDDVWELDKLEKQVPVLDGDENIGAVFAVPTFIDSKGESIAVSRDEFAPSLNPKTKQEWMNHFFNKGNCICHPSILIRKACYENVGFYNPAFRSIPDFEMWVRLFYHYDIIISNETLIKFRKHDFNESGSNTANIIRCHTEYKQILHRFVEQIKTTEELELIFPEHIGSFKVKKDILVPFYIAQISLQRKEPLFPDFAFDILYAEMAKPEVLALIEKYNLYNFVQLSKDVVAADIYAIQKVADMQEKVADMQKNFTIQLDRIYNSRSWQCTAPLRKVGSLIRRILRH